jgi:crotonobetainyl-CoA:carnitine CoA-transferase CaiB-like acyl-CoA transferase
MGTKDGYLMVGAAGQAIWARCAAALGHPEWCDDPRFATNEQRMQNRATLEAEIEAVLATATSDHWVEVLKRPACLAVRRRGLVQYASHPDLGEVPTSAPRARSATMSACAPSPQARPTQR